jgi:hypothetical protein
MTYNNFLHEYRPGIEYHANLRNINDVSVQQVFDKYSKFGYIIISPSASVAELRLDPLDAELSAKKNDLNASRIREMIEILKKNRYSYMPVYARFVERADIFHEEHTYERALIIFNYHYGYNIHEAGNAETLKGLVELGLHLAEQFNQAFFLYQEPGLSMQYIYSDGTRQTYLSLCDKTDFNELTQQYWVDLRDRLTGNDTRKNLTSQGILRTVCRQFEIEKRYAGCYVNPAPSGISQRRGRSASKEIFPTI